MILFVLILLIVAWGRFNDADKYTSELCCGKGPVFYFNFYRYIYTVKLWKVLYCCSEILILNCDSCKWDFYIYFTPLTVPLCSSWGQSGSSTITTTTTSKFTYQLVKLIETNLNLNDCCEAQGKGRAKGRLRTGHSKVIYIL